MGAPLGDTLNTADVTGTETSAYAGDDGSGNAKLFHYHAVDDGANAALGSTGDAAVTNPATDATLIAYTRGVLTELVAILAQLTAGTAGALPKLEDAAHASGDAGIMALSVRQDTAAALAGTTGDYQPLTTNANGRLRVIDRKDEVTPSNATSTALEATNVVKASAGTLFGVQGYTDSAGYIIIGDKATALNGTSDNIKIIIPVESGKPFSLDLGRGRAFANGISIGFSSAAPTFTSGGAHMFMDAQYE